VHRGGTMARLGRFLRDLDRRRLPIHITPVVRQAIETIAGSLPRREATIFRSLLRPALAGRTIRLLGTGGALFEPMLRNTVNATIVHGGEKVNVVPSRIELELDGRLLPGLSPDVLIDELLAVVGDDVEVELLRHDPGGPAPDLTHFEALAQILRELDPQAIPLPLLQIGVTDGRFFSQLGIQTYGFIPMRLPDAFPFLRFIHAADERIPAEAVEFGTEAIYRAIQRL
jgi:acetylornithine deacetylase/succinyl-diaminopimelate desuccinylase-like protein